MRWLKRIGYAVGALVVVVIVAVGAVYAMSELRFRKTYSVPDEHIAVSDDSATLARGAHLAASVGCADCHGEGLRGNAVIDAPPMGRLVALNLTKGEGGVGGQLTPELIERAVRHGVSPSGQPLRIMPSNDYQYMSDDDMRAVASYVQHVAPANNTLAPSRLMLLPRVLMVANVDGKRRDVLPGNYHALPLREKLYCKRSDIPAVTHLDFSARVQTVDRETNPRFWQLLSSFKRKTGYSLVINTSFNVRGEPIVCTPEDAYKCFMRTEMDCLVVGNYVFEKDTHSQRS
jgi:mono/diheme cytochrome c family protein